MRTGRLAAAAVAATALAVPASASAAEQLAAVTNSNKILTFASDSPGNIDTAQPITNLPTGEKIVGIDTRPATGQLYALGRTGRLYTLSTSSGKAQLATALTVAPPVSGAYGFNFNPVSDRIRITTDSRQNYAVNPDTGAVTTNPVLTYAPGQGAGAIPAIGGVAYTNPSKGATSTTLYDIDGGRNSLTIQNTTTGQLTTVGNGLGQDVNLGSGFDINTQNVGFASYKPAATGAVNLYQLNLGVGTAVAASSQPAIGTRAAADDTIAVATLGTVANDTSAAKLTADSPTSASRVNLSRGRSFLANVGLSEAGRIQLDMRIGRTLVAQGKAEVFTRAGATRIRIAATSDGRRVLASKRFKSAKMRFSARDRAGNLTKQGVRTFTLR